MRLITHNIVQCHVKTCTTNNFPLHLEHIELNDTKTTDFNADFLVNFLPRLDWNALQQTAMALGCTGLPPQPPAEPEHEPEFLRALHHVLLEIEITQGQMRCLNCQRVYPIVDGIPNMLLQEDEV